MSTKLAKKVAATYVGRLHRRSRVASKPVLPEGEPPKQALLQPETAVASWFCQDWQEGYGVWQDVYSSEVDQYHQTPTTPLRLRLRTCTDEEHVLTAHVGVNLETGRYEVIRRTGAIGVRGFPKEGHTLDTILGWVGTDEYSERAIYIPNAIDPNAERWKKAMSINVKYRVIKQLTALPL